MHYNWTFSRPTWRHHTASALTSQGEGCKVKVVCQSHVLGRCAYLHICIWLQVLIWEVGIAVLRYMKNQNPNWFWWLPWATMNLQEYPLDLMKHQLYFQNSFHHILDLTIHSTIFGCCCSLLNILRNTWTTCE